MRKSQLWIVIILAGLLAVLTFKKCRSQKASMPQASSKALESKEAVVSAEAPDSDKNSSQGILTSLSTTTTLGSDKPKLTAEVISAKRHQAKSALSNAYAAQISYFSEYERYTTDLISAGSYPPSRVMNFKFGFLRPKASSPINELPNQENPNRLNSDALEGESFGNADEKFAYSKEAQNIRLDDYSSFCRSDCTASEDQFEIILALPLDAAHTDVWLINHKKEMILVQDGATLP